MINARNSEDYLHTEVILAKVSEYDIFKHYCPNFKELGVKFCSDLRADSHPSCSIVEWNNKLLYKDFANEKHTFNCFSYVMYKYGIDFISSLETISRDFGLGLVANSTTRVAKIYSAPEQSVRKRSKIYIRSREWDERDKLFWGKYGIKKSLLTRYNVIPIDYFWINDSRFRVKDIGYAYKFKDGYKIYQPYDPENKWYSNVGTNTVQGLEQLPNTGDVVFITSSLKDVLTLASMNYSAIAPQSEMATIDDKFICGLKESFTIIVVLYDNDFQSQTNPGQTMATKLCTRFSLFNLCIPTEFRCKDVSDLVANYGMGHAKSFIENALTQWTAENELIPF